MASAAVYASTAWPIAITSAHCDLCVHVGGTAGSPPLAAAIGKPLLARHARHLPQGVRLAVRARAPALQYEELFPWPCFPAAPRT
jgi:hypothetical protein